LLIKFYYSYLKQHAGVVIDPGLREYIKVEGSTFVLFGCVIPMEGTYSELERHELLTGIADLLISLLYCIVIVRLVFQ
jgi:hypothetical protein